MIYGKNKQKESMLLMLEVDLLTLIHRNGKKIFITIDILQKRDKIKTQILQKLNLNKLEQKCCKYLKTGLYIHK
jgi:hypothetical protein